MIRILLPDEPDYGADLAQLIERGRAAHGRAVALRLAPGGGRAP